MTISGAYGRDYKSASKVKEDWANNKDFIIRDVFSGAGRYINKEDALGQNIQGIYCRYDHDRRIVRVV